MELLHLLAQSADPYVGPGSAIGGMLLLLIYMALIALVVAGLWRVFQKAGRPGWAALVPIYNNYVLLKIAGRPGWWLLLVLIPLVNIVVAAIVSVDIARAFGRSDLFGIVGLWLFSIIGYLMLGFGDDKYLGAPTAGVVS